MNDDEARLAHWAGASEFGAAVAVSTRHGGLSSGPYATLNLGLHVDDDPAIVVVNRQRVAHSFGVNPASMVFAQQVHGVRPSVVGPRDQGRGVTSMDDAIPATDILVTTARETTLVILVADCVPLALIDPAAGILAVVHAGWRGTAANAVGAAVATLGELGGDPDRIVAFIGPAVHPKNYEVDEVVYDALRDAVAPHPPALDVAQPHGPGHWLVDLPLANRQQLELAGIAPSRIYGAETTTSDDDYFSDRAARPCGRFALMARLLG